MKQFTNKELAELTGVTSQAVSQWLSGNTYPTLKNAIKMRDKFKIPVDSWGRKSFITTSSHKNKELQDV